MRTDRPFLVTPAQLSAWSLSLTLEHTRRAAGMALSLVLILGLAGCAKDNPFEPDPLQPFAISVIPSHAPPGVALELVDLTLDTTALESYTVFVGGVQSYLSLDPVGTVTTVAPIFFDPELKWHAPPVGLLDIVVFRNDSLFATALQSYTSDPLPSSTGETQRVVTSLNSLAASLKGVVAAFDTDVGLQQQLLYAVATAIDSLVVELDLESTTALSTADPRILELLDSYLGAADVDQKIVAIADGFASLATNLGATPAPTAGESGAVGSAAIEFGGSDDASLSSMMQTAAILDEYTNSFVQGTAEGLDGVGAIITTVELALGFLGLGPLAEQFDKYFSAVSSGYSLLNLVMAKFIVASLPTKLDSLVIRFGSSSDLFLTDTVATLTLGDTTHSVLMVFASSEPPAITANDFVEQFLNIAGLVGPKAKGSKQEILDNLNKILDVMKKALKEYKAQNPDFGYDPDIVDLFAIPKNHWQVPVTTSALVDLRQSGGGVLTALPDELEWLGAGTGVGNVSFEPVPVSRVGVGIFPGAGVVPFVYSGTSFGIPDSAEVFVSRDYEVTVGKALWVDAVFPGQIRGDTVTELQVTAGYFDISGTKVPEPRLEVDLSVQGGLASPSQGLTGSDGEFVSDIFTSSARDSVHIVVTVSDSLQQEIADTLAASVGLAILLEATMPDSVEAGTPFPIFGRAGLITAAGDTVFEAGVDIELVAVGGVAVPASTVTDADGNWEAEGTLDAAAPTFRVRITATFTGAGTHSIELTAESRPGGSALAGSQNSFARTRVALVGCDQEEQVVAADFQTLSWNLGGLCPIPPTPTDPDPKRLDARTSGTMTFSVDPVTGELFGTTLSATLDAVEDRSSIANDASVADILSFTVVGAPVQFTATGSASGSGDFWAAGFSLISGSTVIYRVFGGTLRGGEARLNQTGTLPPGSYEVRATGSVTENGSMTIDFRITLR